MADIYEQRINIKVLQTRENVYRDSWNDKKRLWWLVHELYTLLWIVYDLRMVGSQHMMSRVWDSPQRHETTLMLNKFVKSLFDSARNSKRVQHIDRIVSWYFYDKITRRKASGNLILFPTISDTGLER
jgi:hypothetical protein